MLQEIMEYICNYFVPICAKEVTYTISDGRISPDFGADDGDRFLVCGSRRNDGVYTFHEDTIKNDDDNLEAGLQDETFAGTIRVMSVPPALIALSEEINQWVDKNSDALNSPYASEQFNGYSYSLKSGGSKLQSATTPFGWQDQFKTRLDRWRRPFV